jgi:xylulokinase
MNDESPRGSDTSVREGLILGYDLGTSSVKAVLVDARGAIRASASAAYPLHLPAPGYAEQRPQDWWEALGSVTRELLSSDPTLRDQVRALGIGAQLCGCVLVDASGEPLHPCLIWMDTRSAPIARRITAGGPRVAGYGLFRILDWLYLANGAPNLSGKDPLTKMLWLRENHPELWARGARVLDVKDWLIHQLTGEFTTTPDAAQLTWLMNNRIGKRDWSDRHLRRFGLSRAQLPNIIDADAQAGTLSARAAEHLGLAPGLPVAGGVGDINACALAAGDQQERAYHLYLGTSMWVAAHYGRRRVDPFSGIATVCAAHRDRFLWIATQECAGAAVTWAAETFGFGQGKTALRTLDACAAAAPRRGDVPLFTPWLFGERVPVDNPHLRSALAGVSLRTGRADIARAVLTGVALNTRWALEHAERSLPALSPSIPMMGGGGNSEVWVQVLADVLQRPLEVLEQPTLAGARGAAICATRVAQWYERLDDAAVAMAAAHHTVAPDPAQKAWADTQYRRFTRFYRATQSWHLASQSKPPASH